MNKDLNKNDLNVVCEVFYNASLDSIVERKTFIDYYGAALRTQVTFFTDNDEVMIYTQGLVKEVGFCTNSQSVKLDEYEETI